ncbi:PREDICTED: AMSH-like ubiquitin thioesterase 2 isoform X1 [Ipomoea nil]|uniref:AMSH-like ubiquitin thioesterase 2 isoform X1 n=2 Tax=Ipomoea nil TaxID=35883 RepID=UPI0009013A2B|nr:PREDICTED: AMSH-like ubiquitin thioesterase 2 isoform X1 [Ipomoea nil]XP_019164190.1 PREDICTED: AMSH-like ubiquitin thioesterase 2 isoform X1 [Ipomoea nil]
MAYGVCHHQFDVKTVTQSSPSPVISLVHTLPYGAEPLLHSDTGSSASPSTSSGNEQEASKALKDVHLPTRLMDMFLDLASGNTSKDLETCGVLGASLKKGTFYVTTLIIPKQESESNSCQALHEEEIFSIQNQQGLFPIGWIHTHPSQSCFMSSIDLHTQYSYQVMVPEAVGIVMAPTDKSRDYGIFRLSNGGMRILKDCSEKGFHPHREPADGSSIYEDCSNVYVNQNLRLEICDLR